MIATATPGWSGCALLVPVTNAIVGIDLADSKQMVVVTDHDSKVLARRTFRCRAWDLGAALDWAAERAAAAGFAGVTVACEPTGHRWRVLGQLAADRGMPFVCVQPMVTSWARRTEDLTSDKTDEKDAVLIARLTAQLRCYLPEPVDETWGRLRHLGARREQLIDRDVQPDPADPRPARSASGPPRWTPPGSRSGPRTWVAAMTVIIDRDGGDLARTRRLGPARFEQAVRREITRRGGQKPCLRIVRELFAALTDPAGVIAHRPGALERVALLLEDWDARPGPARRHRAADDRRPGRARADRAGHLDHRAVGGRRRGDPGRDRRPEPVRHRPRAWSSTPAWPRGRSCPAPSPAGPSSPAQGRPGLRLAAWRAVWGAQRANPVYAARYRHLTTRETQQAHPHPGPDRHRRRDPAAPARRHHHRPGLGPGHRHPRHPTGRDCGITRPRISTSGGRPKLAAGASPPRH